MSEIDLVHTSERSPLGVGIFAVEPSHLGAVELFHFPFLLRTSTHRDGSTGSDGQSVRGGEPAGNGRRHQLRSLAAGSNSALLSGGAPISDWDEEEAINVRAATRTLSTDCGNAKGKRDQRKMDERPSGVHSATIPLVIR